MGALGSTLSLRPQLPWRALTKLYIFGAAEAGSSLPYKIRQITLTGKLG